MAAFRPDDGILKMVFKKTMDKYFPDEAIHHAKIQYVFFDDEKKTSDGRVILGESSILPTLTRDIYGGDFAIAVFSEYWDNTDMKNKIRLALHELTHCVVCTDKDGDLAYDKHDRLKIKIKKHDIVFNLFEKEISDMGLSHDEFSSLSEVFYMAESKNKKKKLKRKK